LHPGWRRDGRNLKIKGRKNPSPMKTSGLPQARCFIQLKERTGYRGGENAKRYCRGERVIFENGEYARRSGVLWKGKSSRPSVGHAIGRETTTREGEG